jgi:hypothetical protein
MSKGQDIPRPASKLAGAFFYYGYFGSFSGRYVY